MRPRALAFIAALVAGAVAGAATNELPDAKPLSFSAVATPPKAKFGSEIRYEIAVQHPKEDAYSLSDESELGSFQVVATSKSRSDKGGEASTRFVLKLVLFDVGDVKIPDVTLFVDGPSGPRKLVIPGPTVTGASDLPEDEKMRDTRPPVPLWIRSYRSLAILGIAAAVLLIGWMIWRLLSRRQATEVALPPEAPHLRALRELAALRAEDLPGKGRKKEMHFRMSEIVRRYLGQRFGFNAIDLTTAELMTTLRTVDAPGLDYGEFQRFCEEGDLVKFAKWDPPDADCMKALGAAVAFVQRTAPPSVAAFPPARAA